jgi:hypothetical protein
VTENVIDWVWERSRAVNGSLIVLLAIVHAANGDGEAEMSAAELAAKCRLGERTVQAAVKDLTATGELLARRGGGRGHRTQYRVLAGNPAESAPFTELNPAESAPFQETPQNLHPAESAPFNGHHRRSERNPAESAGLGIPDMFITTTGIEEVQVKPKSEIVRADVEHLCDHLADRIAANGSKRPVIGKRWRDAARLMIDSDGRTEQQIHAAIDWCQDSEFWRANILSMPKLREKYDQLRLRAQAALNGNGNGRQAQTDALFDAAMNRALAKEGRK